MATSNSDVPTSVAHAPLSTSTSISTPPSAPSHNSCRTKKTEGASFIQDIRDHFDEFVHASMDEHKACFKNTLNKVNHEFCLQIGFLVVHKILD